MLAVTPAREGHGQPRRAAGDAEHSFGMFDSAARIRTTMADMERCVDAAHGLPTFGALATQLDNNVALGGVDATAHPALRARSGALLHAARPPARTRRRRRCRARGGDAWAAPVAFHVAVGAARPTAIALTSFAVNGWAERRLEYWLRCQWLGRARLGNAPSQANGRTASRPRAPLNSLHQYCIRGARAPAVAVHCNRTAHRCHRARCRRAPNRGGGERSGGHRVHDRCHARTSSSNGKTPASGTAAST